MIYGILFRLILILTDFNLLLCGAEHTFLVPTLDTQINALPEYELRNLQRPPQIQRPGCL